MMAASDKGVVLGQVEHGSVDPGLGGAMPGEIRLKIDVTATESIMEALSTDWSDYAANNEHMRSGDRNWSPKKQAVYMALKDSSRRDLAEDLRKAEFESVLQHECKHVIDRAWGLPAAEAETKAALAELIRSPLALRGLENRWPFALRGLEKHFTPSEPHDAAAARIFAGLGEFADMQDERSLYSHEPEEISRRARILYERWFGPYASPDPACLRSLPWEAVRQSGK